MARQVGVALRADSRRRQRGHPVLHAPLHRAADSQRRDRSGVRGVGFPDLPRTQAQAGMTPAGCIINSLTCNRTFQRGAAYAHRLSRPDHPFECMRGRPACQQHCGSTSRLAGGSRLGAAGRRSHVLHSSDKCAAGMAESARVPSPASRSAGLGTADPSGRTWRWRSCHGP